jgi:hypothetical protein
MKMTAKRNGGEPAKMARQCGGSEETMKAAIERNHRKKYSQAMAKKWLEQLNARRRSIISK